MVATKLSQVAEKGWGWYNGGSGKKEGNDETTKASSTTVGSSVHHPKDTTATTTTDTAPTSTSTSTTTANSTTTGDKHNTSHRLFANTPKKSSLTSSFRTNENVSDDNNNYDSDDDSSSCSSSYPRHRQATTTTTTSSPASYMDEAYDAVEQTYSTLSSHMQSMGWSSTSSSSDRNITQNTGGGDGFHSERGGEENSRIVENLPNSISKDQTLTAPRRGSLLTSPLVLNLFHNPYVAVRGHQPHTKVTSMEAVRSLINTVPTPPMYSSTSGENSTGHASEASSLVQNDASVHTEGSYYRASGSLNFGEREYSQQQSFGHQSSSAEMASQLAEGTLRAYRDIALDEAVQLHEALRYWAYRWERPLLSWIEAGPGVWMSEEGYQHQKVGQKVSQIQAVLARRCATIGDLQSHLLRAGWQRGVAQWGVLGGEWLTTGNDGRMGESFKTNDVDPPLIPSPQAFAFHRVPSAMIDHMPPPSRGPQLPRKGPSSNVSQLPQQSRHNQLYYTNVFVKNNDGGHILIDDPALAEWSVDAMLLVRRQLYRAANGQIELPYAENWADGDDQSRHSFEQRAGSTFHDSMNISPRSLPLWASLKHATENNDTFMDPGAGEHDRASNKVEISDLPLLVNEVSDILDIMESVIQIQRDRRLEKLKPIPWISRNWYMGALATPPLLYLTYKGLQNGKGISILKSLGRSISHFFQEHVVEPLYAMYDEFTKGTVDVSDRQARDVAIKNLKKMIRSWLDETHPDMSLKERKRMARSMDISLIEAEKEESMKTLYNINSVIRMSFIEAQFLKKEMMNALLAMDEMRASTNFNMNLAAVTPFVLLTLAIQKTFKFVYYAILRMGKSREETFGSFFLILTEIERLLVMRDNPPAPNSHQNDTHNESSQTFLVDTVLNADDLGMLMLHIHELRTVLWQDRRRFSPNILRSVVNDLAELAGERGAVSVRQQLQIISGMCRNYPFLRNITNQMYSYR